MSDQIELLRNKLENSDSLIDSEVIYLSQKLDKLIIQYYSCKVEI
ncbi:aspartyl-phosphate phosphatase Spo0E family protein [Clostridium algoriphilum]|nr:aspartyl-phosphate phosphatase Spo0E family protein [Clostridium algoriphilum]MCB2295830.1 aspartyl-phosphate phosphatase Spo0E family protein [Clostridium algoriphilum]